LTWRNNPPFSTLGGGVVQLRVLRRTDNKTERRRRSYRARKVEKIACCFSLAEFMNYLRIVQLSYQGERLRESVPDSLKWHWSPGQLNLLASHSRTSPDRRKVHCGVSVRHFLPHRRAAICQDRGTNSYRHFGIKTGNENGM
jgi:hypothetical protein